MVEQGNIRLFADVVIRQLLYPKARIKSNKYSWEKSAKQVESLICDL